MEEKELIEDGIHNLSGVELYSKQDEYGIYDGVVLRIDGEDYIFFVNPDDGYRSYSCCYKSDKRIVKNIFSDQKVIVKNEHVDTVDDSGMWPISYHTMLFLNESNEEILRVGTNTSDNYYPMAIFHYYPENLPINKGR